MRGVLPLVALATISSGPARPTPIEGFWKNPSGTAIIGIAPCGTTLCGKVLWASARGQREVAATTRNVVGTTVLTRLRASGDHWTGALFIPDDNIHVSARLQLEGGRGLKLTGCAFATFFCRTQLWSRVEVLPSSS
jgi:uncharacterized protein (DUF2147 family)